MEELFCFSFIFLPNLNFIPKIRKGDNLKFRVRKLNVGVKLIFLGRVEKGGRFLKQKIVMLDVSFYATTKKKLKRNNFF